MPKKYYRKLLCNKKIVIEDILPDVFIANPDDPYDCIKINENLIKAGVFMMFLHEFTHYAIRFSKNTFGDVLDYERPRSLQAKVQLD